VATSAANAEDNDRIRTLYHLLLSREPTSRELRLGTEALDHFRRHWSGDEPAALTSYCHTLLNSAAFLFVD